MPLGYSLENNEVKSIALQQLGNINEKKNKLEEALSFYKKSILADNTNNDSKFNYELVKKKIQENQNQNLKYFVFYMVVSLNYVYLN